MAVPITDKPNTEAPSTPYPYGNIRDNDGTNNGTPVNKLVYADFHQFFARLMAVTSTAYNGLVENVTNGFQYISALDAFVRNTFATTGARGTVEIATQPEVDAGTDQERVITPFSMNATDTLVHNVTTGVRLATKVIEIGDWDMDTNATKAVAHGLGSNWNKIRSFSAIIRTDDGTLCFNISAMTDLVGNVVAGSIASFDATNINLSRAAGELFDSTDFNSVIYNRGWVTIVYQTN
jgi:hypothetical protein